MRSSRPKNLNLLTIHFPLPAIVSILHRASGAVLFLLIPCMLWLLQISLTYEGFDAIQQWMGSFFVKVVVWLLLAAFFYHLVAGIRHLLSDLHIGDTLKAGRRGAIITFVVSGLIILLAGVWLW